METTLENCDSQNQRKKRKKRPPRDPNRPKQPKSAYMHFMQDAREQVKSDNPHISDIKDIAREVGRRWNDLSEQQRKYYEEMAEVDKSRYQKEIKEYKDGIGMFIRLSVCLSFFLFFFCLV